MDSNVIDDLDVDFMNEILGSSELHMADNMIQDLMGDMDNDMAPKPNNQTWFGQNQNFNSLDQNFHQLADTYHAEVNQPQVYQSQQVAYEAPDFSNSLMPVTMPANNQNMIILSNQAQMEVPLLNVEPQSIFIYNGNEASGKKVRKNLKDILNSDTTGSNDPGYFGMAPQVVSPIGQNFQMPLTPPSPILTKTEANLRPEKESKKARKSKVHSENLSQLDLGAEGKKTKAPKRTSHNAIEKKYRSSINDKILELKIKVAGKDVKLQKSGILRKALDYINNLEDNNRQLVDENTKLRTALQTISLNSSNLAVIQSVVNSVSLAEPKLRLIESPNTPPSSGSSMEDDSYLSGSDSENSLTQHSPNIVQKQSQSKTEPSYKRKKLKKEAIKESSRVVLCMVVMSVLLFNPFNLLLPSANVQTEPVAVYQGEKWSHGRVLNWYHVNSTGTDQTSDRHNNFNFVLSWILNSALVLFCVVKVCISGDSYVSLDAHNFDAISFHYQQAEKKFQQNKYEEAFVSLEKGLNELGQAVPRTKIELITGIAWQLSRLALNRLYIGILFTRLGMWLYGLKNCKMYKLGALFYYEMHKFSYLNMKSERDFVLKTTSAQTSSYSLLMWLYYALSMHNMSETYTRLVRGRGKQLALRDKFNLCEFYFSIILASKFRLPSHLTKILSKHFLKTSLFTMLDGTESEDDDEQRCKLRKLKSLLNKNLFIHYLVNFEDYSCAKTMKKAESGECKANVLNLIQYKRRLLASSFLYDSDDSLDSSCHTRITCTNGVSCEFLMAKFQDFLLSKMTNHIFNDSGVISIQRLLKPDYSGIEDSLENISKLNSSADLDEQNKELADVDQIKFERFKLMYRSNMDYFSASDLKKNTQVQLEAHLVLIEFLSMLNNWKVRKFDSKIMDTNQMKNSQNSLFIESIINLLKAYENLSEP
ncbi:sterol regulatory element-binding 1-like, partial [Brachionus plicatilis]